MQELDEISWNGTPSTTNDAPLDAHSPNNITGSSSTTVTTSSSTSSDKKTRVRVAISEHSSSFTNVSLLFKLFIICQTLFAFTQKRTKAHHCFEWRVYSICSDSKRGSNHIAPFARTASAICQHPAMDLLWNWQDAARLSSRSVNTLHVHEEERQNSEFIGNITSIYMHVSGPHHRDVATHRRDWPTTNRLFLAGSMLSRHIQGLYQHQ